MIATSVDGTNFVILGRNQIMNMAAATMQREYISVLPDIQTDSPMLLIVLN